MIFVGVVSAQLSVTDFSNYQVIQRDIGGNSKRVTVTGTTGSTQRTSVEARVLRHGTTDVVVPWTQISESGSGAFSGSLVVGQGGWYNIEVRMLGAGGTVLGSSRKTNKWGVGMNILCIGQSNMSGCGGPWHAPITYTAATDLAANFTNMGYWDHLKDPYDYPSPPNAVDSDNHVQGFQWHRMGSMIPGLANSLVETFGIPVGFIPAAKGGSPLVGTDGGCWSYRNPSTSVTYTDTTSLYGYSLLKAQRAGGVELIIMHQGEQDVNDKRSRQAYMNAFTSMLNNYRRHPDSTYLGRSAVPIFFGQIGRINVGWWSDTAAADIRGAHQMLDNGIDRFMALTGIDLGLQDAAHYNYGGYDTLGVRMANAIKHSYNPSQFPYYRGPNISSAFFVDRTRQVIDVHITHRGGNDITPSTNITGFSVLVDGTSSSIVTAVRDASDRIRLTLSSPVADGATATLRYLWGLMPDITGIVRDNSSLGLPLEGTTNDLTITNEPLSRVTVIAATPNASESGPTPGHFTLTRDLTQNALTVHYTLSGTAINGVDYQTLEESVQFAAGASQTTVTVMPIDDDISELDETVILTLAYNSAYLLGSPTSATVIIADNDPPLPTVTVTATDPHASESGPGHGAFTVTRTFTTGNLTVYYALSGTATNGADYQTLSGSVVIASGQAQAVIPVTVIDDDEAEGNEHVVLTILPNAAYHVGSPSKDSVLIVDNDITEYVWHSYNSRIRSTAPHGRIPNESGTPDSANLVFYLSSDNNGVDYGTDPEYRSGGHPLTWWTNVGSGYWTWNENGYDFPYVGLDATMRGSSDPAPDGVYDIAVHPPIDERLTVIAFVAPMAGRYTVSNLGVRRVSTGGISVKLKLFGKTKSVIDSIRATNNLAWVFSSTTYSLGQLAAGDSIFFAVDNDHSGEQWAWEYDGTEIAFTVTATTSTANRAPLAVDDAVTTPEDTPVTISVLANDSDPDGDVLSVTAITQQPKRGTAVINAATTITYTPSLNFFGNDTPVYTISDGRGGSASAMVRITVTPVNDPPVLSAIGPKSAAENSPLTFTISASDPDNEVLTLTATSLPSGARFTDHGNRTATFSWTPWFGQTGSYQVTFRASDGSLSAQEVVTITVTTAQKGSITIAGVSAACSVSLYASTGWTGEHQRKGVGTIVDLFPGHHLLGLKETGRRTEYVPVAITSGNNTTVTVDMRSPVPLSVAYPETLSTSSGKLALGGPASVVFGDFVGDGKLRLAAVRRNGTVRFFEKSGQSYAEVGIWNSGRTNVQCIRAVDWNRDTRTDLIIATRGGQIQVFLNQGSFAFEPGAVLVSGTDSLSGFDMADLNGDGNPDFLIGCPNGEISRILSSGSSWSNAVVCSLSNGTRLDVGDSAAPLIIDLTADGIPDLIVTGNGGNLAWYEGLSNGRYISRGNLNIAGAPLPLTRHTGISYLYGPVGDMGSLVLSTQSGNVLTATIAVRGDIAGNDGIVGAADLSAFGDAWGRTQDDPQWNMLYRYSNFDLTPGPDGKQVIDIRDLGIFGNVWGNQK